MENEWFPSLEEYNPGITKEQWIEFVQDKNIFNENSLITFACIQKAKVATCADMTEDFGRNTNFYNSNVWRTGERIYKKINCPLWQRENGTDRFWSVCCFGRDLKNGRFEFKIRSELQEAFNETGVLEGIEIMGEKENISCIMANIAWNDNEWKQPSDNKTNFRWTQQEGNIAQESWNFDFDNPRNNENEILGFTQFKNPPKNAEKDKFLIIFRSSNKIIGFYGNAEIKKVPLVIKDNESVNLLGDKKFSLLLENKIDDSNHNFLFGKERISQGGFNKIDNKDAIKIIDEAIKLNPSQIEVLNKLKDWLIQGESQMQNDLINETKKLLENTKNIILTGAPGTGKTFMAKQIAKELGCEDDNIGFVQFHPSYDYTDFVEGLRPTDKDGNGNVGFERKDGVFKAFCEKALKNLVDSRKTVEEQKADNYFEKVYSMLINDIEEGICSLYKTAKGDFSVSIHENGNLCFEQNNPKKIYVKKDYLEILFNVIKDDNDLDIKNISREDMDKLVGDNVKTISHVDYIQYRWALNQLLERYKQIKNTYTSEITEKIQAKNFVFIIDEINRGEVAKIFGELFYSVDPGYRVTSDDLNAIKNGNKTITTIKTQYANLETEGNEFDKVLQKKEKDFGHFFIPENVYIIGTMNDIDRSVESMDFAFRRRFSWIEVKAEDTQYMLDAELDAVLAKEAKRRMDNLNAAISKLPDLNDAYHIGASYFLKLKNYESDSDNGFQSLWNYHLKGILEEYLRGNPDKDKYLKQLENAYTGESDKTSNQQ